MKKKEIVIKSFQSLMEKRFTKEEIAEIEQEARLEFQAFKALQDDVTHVVDDYMHEQNIGFNELVDRLAVSPAHIAKIKKGTANLTLASVARLCAVMGKKPRLVCQKAVKSRKKLKV